MLGMLQAKESAQPILLAFLLTAGAHLTLQEPAPMKETIKLLAQHFLAKLLVPVLTSLQLLLIAMCSGLTCWSTCKPHCHQQTFGSHFLLGGPMRVLENWEMKLPLLKIGAAGKANGGW